MCTALRSTALALVPFLLLIFGGDTGFLVRLLALLIVVLLAGLLPPAALLLATGIAACCVDFDRTSSYSLV